jgi:hypothetical protein
VRLLNAVGSSGVMILRLTNIVPLKGGLASAYANVRTIVRKMYVAFFIIPFP